MNPLKILTMLVENIRKITLAQITLPESGVIMFNGPNESGKSTMLKSVLYALKGKTGIDNPDTVIQEGQSKGKIELTVGESQGTPEYKLRLLFRKGGPVLKVERIDGGVLPEGLTQGQLIKKFYNDVALDPLKFAQANPKEQKEILVGIAQFQLDDEYHKLVGEHADLGPVDALDAAEKAAFEVRTVVNREVRNAEGQLQQYADVDMNIEGVTVEDVSEEMTNLNERKMKRGQISTFLANAMQEVSRIESELERAKAQVANYQAQLDAVPPVDEIRLAKLQETLRNMKVYQRAAEKKRIYDDKVRADREATRLTNLIDRIREYRIKMIEGAQLPIDGLGFSYESGGVTYCDEPLEARGISKNLVIGAAVAKALNPIIKLILLDQGSELDDRRVIELAQWAQANDSMVLMAREKPLDADGVVSFSIDDGGMVS